MALPGPGVPLSLNDIKGEFGGPSSPSLADYYAGGSYVASGISGTYGAVPTSGAISIRNFYGTSASQSITITVGISGVRPYQSYGFGSGSTAFGSLSTTTFNPNGGTIVAMYWGNTIDTLEFALTGFYGNSGWTNFSVNGNNFARTSATYSTVGGNSQWQWSTASNPIGTSGTASWVIT